jgi:hypothetical protein
MTRALVILAAALPLAAQPKLLVNAQTDTRSAASGLEGQYKALLTTQPQPAWIGYSVAAVRTPGLGCEYVSNVGLTSGVIHLEPPDQALVLIRIEGNEITRIRTTSPQCEIDAGGVPVHWLTDVKPEQSIALLKSLMTERDRLGTGMLTAIAWHASPLADQTLEGYLASSQPDSLRQRAISLIGQTRGRAGFERLRKIAAEDPDERTRERALMAMANSREVDATDVLIGFAKNDASAHVRSQAIGALQQKQGRRVLDALLTAAKTDKDASVRRRAISALQSLPDGEGVPALIELAKQSGDLDVRKQAMSQLGSSRDPRALGFLEEVLKK